MKFINSNALRSVDVADFQGKKPYPWTNPKGIITDEGYAVLAANMPDISIFYKDFGTPRKYGEKPHNRFRLWYSKSAEQLPDVWKEFANELMNGGEYKSFIASLFGTDKFSLRLEWHYTPAGCAVYPHLDGPTTYGAHLFYFNTEQEWDPSWGGQTLILTSNKELALDSKPEFEDFTTATGTCVGNYSIIFKNQENSWHGVRENSAPEGKYRKLFTIFFVKEPSFVDKIKAKIKKIFG